MTLLVNKFDKFVNLMISYFKGLVRLRSECRVNLNWLQRRVSRFLVPLNEHNQKVCDEDQHAYVGHADGCEVESFPALESTT